MQGQPTVIVLAAGKGERFLAAGGKTHKLQAVVHGKTVLQHTLQAVVRTGLPVHVVHPRADLQTMGDSIAAGVAATLDAKGWLVLPADLPAVLPQTISAVARAIEQGLPVARPVYGDRIGHPVGFTSSLRTELLNCRGFPGAVHLISMFFAMKIEVSDQGCVSDVDTPQALSEVCRLMAERDRPEFVT